MLKVITRILPFFIITLLCLVGVELFYGVVERYFVPPEKGGADNLVTDSSAIKTPVTLEKHNDYSVIAERNLFQSYLKEAVSQEEPSKENPLEGLESTKLDLVLMGTITGQTGRSRAIILEKANKKQEIYYKGDVVKNAQIKDILRGKVILSYDGNDEILDMSEATTQQPKQVTPPAAVGPKKTRRRVVSRSIPRARRPVPPPQARGRMNEPPDENEEEPPDDEDLDDEDIVVEPPGIDEEPLERNNGGEPPKEDAENMDVNGQENEQDEQDGNGKKKPIRVKGSNPRAVNEKEQ